MSKKEGTGTYFIFDRLFYLMEVQTLRLDKYCSKFNISVRTARRDMEHLKLFYDYNFNYDTFNNCYYVEKLENE